MTYTQKRFWVGTAERAVKTAAQTAVATIGAGTIGVMEMDWINLLSIVAMAAILSVCTSLADPAATNFGGAREAEGGRFPSRRSVMPHDTAGEAH